ncbi:hypothetical protein B0H10DRAFT_2201646 [Mycena sp. CBHHK59/15]|nr:hypothetical protein B0H10DRAFT_2201646 [Mycena sp. CBHHK59/15]
MRSKGREAETASCTSKDKTELLELRYGRQSRPETRDSTADRPEVKTQSIDSSDLSKGQHTELLRGALGDDGSREERTWFLRVSPMHEEDGVVWRSRLAGAGKKRDDAEREGGERTRGRREASWGGERLFVVVVGIRTWGARDGGANTGGFRELSHAHIINGIADTQSSIQNHPCPATRTIYIPMDPTIRKALIIHNSNTAHNHPMPALTKASFEMKAAYHKCIEAAGCVRATVSKVDNAPSTMILLNGKKPSEFAAALQLNQTKRKMVRKAKLAAYPAGLDVGGAFQLFWDEMKKPIDERYIHRIATMPDGGVIILTCLSALMRLLDDKGVLIVIFFKALQRAVTIARAYVNHASTKFFERLYDEFQAVKLELTVLHPGGNILAMNSDMEAAQVLGAACYFFKLNDPEYSNLSNDTPGEPEFVKLCTTHGKRYGSAIISSLKIMEGYITL